MNKNLLRYLLLVQIFWFVSSAFSQSNQFLWVNSGGTSNGVINDVAYSTLGNAIVTGGYMSGNGNGSFPITISGGQNQNGVLSRFNNAGGLVWGFSIGGSGIDEITAVAFDNLDNIIVGGTFEGSAAQFQGTSGGLVTLNSNGGKDIFVAKYNSAGVLLWLRQGSSTSDDFIHDITVDASNNIYVAGSAPAGFTYYGNGISSYGGTDGFALKILSDGSFGWINSAGSTGVDEFRSVTVFGGVAYFGGHYKGPSVSLFGTGVSVNNLFSGTSDIFIAKYATATGASSTMATFGGSNNDILTTLTNDGTSLYFAASSLGTLTLGASFYNNIYQENVTAKLTTAFAVTWSHSTTHSLAGDANPGGIGFLPSGRIVVVGDYTGTINCGLASSLLSSSRDGIVYYLNATNGAAVEQTRFYGISNDVGKSIAVKSSIEFFIGGFYTDNCLFPPINVTGTNSTSHPFVGKFGCSTSSTATLTGTTAVCDVQAVNLTVTFVGVGPYSVTITDGTTPVTVSNIATSTYTHSVTPSATSTYSITAFSSANCINTFSGTATVTVYPPVTNNVISANVTLCYGQNGTYTGPIPTGGDGSAPAYLWEYKTGLTWFPGLNTNTLQNYTAVPITQNVQYRRKVTINGCPTHISNVVTATVVPVLSNNIISGNQISCGSFDPVIFSSSYPSGGNGSYSFIWEEDINSSFTNPVVVGNSQDFDPPLQTVTKYFRRTVFSVTCADVSNFLTVQVDPLVANNTISTSQSFCVSGTPSPLIGSTPSGGFGGYTYSWQSSPNGTVWTNVGTGQNYSPGLLSSTTFYRRLVTSGACTTPNASNTVTITVNPAIVANTITANQTSCGSFDPSILSGSSPSGGNSAYTYIWQEDIDSLFPNPISVGTTQNYDPPLQSVTKYYRRIVNSGSCSSTSNFLTVRVDVPLNNNTITANQTFCVSGTPSALVGSLPTGGFGGFVYTWQSSSDGTTWTNVGATQSYSPGLISATTYFRRLATSGACVVPNVSNIITITIDSQISANTISTDQMICAGNTPLALAGSSPAGGDGINYVFQWFESQDSVLWVPASGNNNLINYSPSALAVDYYYFRKVSSGVCPADTSNALSVLVYPSIGNNIISADTAVCYNTSSVLLTGLTAQNGSGSYQYLWESSTDGITYTPATGTNNAMDFTANNLTQSSYFRRKIMDVNCTYDTSVSNVVLVTVYSPISGSFLNPSDTICMGDSFNASFLLSGDGPFDIHFFAGGISQNVNGIIGSSYTYVEIPSTTNAVIWDTLTDVHGCFITPIDTFDYRVVQYPNVQLQNDTTICDSYTFQPVFGNGNLSFVSPTLGNISTNFPLNFTTTLFGTHSFIIAENLEGCISTDTAVITFTEPIGNISAGPDQEYTKVDFIVLAATPLLSNETGIWTLISGSGVFADSSQPNTPFSELLSGQTILEWTVDNVYCPTKTAQVVINIYNLIVPTGFSPNNDGSNDYLEFFGRDDITVINLQVYDRWGTLVYENKNYQNDWNGTDKKGEDLPEDTYFMIVDLGEKGLRKSYLILRR